MPGLQTARSRRACCGCCSALPGFGMNGADTGSSSAALAVMSDDSPLSPAHLQTADWNHAFERVRHRFRRPSTSAHAHHRALSLRVHGSERRDRCPTRWTRVDQLCHSLAFVKGHVSFRPPRPTGVCQRQRLVSHGVGAAREPQHQRPQVGGRQLCFGGGVAGATSDNTRRYAQCGPQCPHTSRATHTHTLGGQGGRPGASQRGRLDSACTSIVGEQNMHVCR